VRILYLHQFFKTPDEAGITRSYFLAGALVAAGHEVVMVTTEVSLSAERKVVHYTSDNGIEVYALPIPYDNAMGIRARAVAFAKYAFQAFRLAESLGKARPFDLVYATSTPLSVGLPAVWLRDKYGWPFVFEVRDLWPDFPVQMGALRNRWVRRWAYQLEARLYRKAAHLVALSPGIAAGIQRVNPKAEISLLPNFSDTSLFYPSSDASEIQHLPYLGEGEKAIVYFGALGIANGVDELFVLADLAYQRGLPWRFYAIGEGAERAKLEGMALALPNAHVLPSVPKKDLPALLRGAHLAYVSFISVPVLATTSPNKFFDALAMGLPVATNVPGWLQSLVQEEGCGFYAERETEAGRQAFLDKAQVVLTNPTLWQQMSQRARDLALGRFSAEKAGKAVVALVGSLAERLNAGTPPQTREAEGNRLLK